MQVEEARLRHTFTFRVRYSETDQMGTFYNSRALEWFEVGRSELARAKNLPYTEWERRGAFLPLIEAWVKFEGRAVYDDLLEMTVSARAMGRVRIRFDNAIVHAETGRPVARGYTVHPVCNREGKPMRIPDWVEHFLDDM